MQLVSDDLLSKLTAPHESTRPVGFDSDVQAFRGVRSGITRKIAAITTRLKRGEPSNRIEREQDKRASRYLLAAFGSIFFGHRGIYTMRTVMESDDRLGKMLVVARHIWMTDAYVQLQSGEAASLEDLMEKYIQTALHRLNSTISEGLSENDNFEIVSWLVFGWLERQPLRTNHLSLSIPSQQEAKAEPEDLISSLKRLIRNETFKRVEQFGWKTIRRIRARCYKVLETGTLEGIFCVRGIVQRLQKGETSLGKRGKHAALFFTPVMDTLERHLIGLSRSTRAFLSMQFDLAIFGIFTFYPPAIKNPH